MRFLVVLKHPWNILTYITNSTTPNIKGVSKEGVDMIVLIFKAGYLIYLIKGSSSWNKENLIFPNMYIYIIGRIETSSWQQVNYCFFVVFWTNSECSSGSSITPKDENDYKSLSCWLPDYIFFLKLKVFSSHLYFPFLPWKPNYFILSTKELFSEGQSFRVNIIRFSNKFS